MFTHVCVYVCVYVHVYIYIHIYMCASPPSREHGTVERIRNVGEKVREGEKRGAGDSREG